MYVYVEAARSAIPRSIILGTLDNLSETSLSSMSHAVQHVLSMHRCLRHRSTVAHICHSIIEATVKSPSTML